MNSLDGVPRDIPCYGSTSGPPICTCWKSNQHLQKCVQEGAKYTPLLLSMMVVDETKWILTLYCNLLSKSPGPSCTSTVFTPVFAVCVCRMIRVKSRTKILKELFNIRVPALPVSEGLLGSTMMSTEYSM